MALKLTEKTLQKCIADILADNTVIIELKATKNHDDVFTAQCLNYLKATGKPICLLLNFGQPRIEIKRFRGRNLATDEHRCNGQFLSFATAAKIRESLEL